MSKNKSRLVCIRCGGKISVSSFHKRKLCFPCAMKLRRGVNNHKWKGGNERCVDCGKELTVLTGTTRTQRCRECYDIFRVERDKHTVCINCGGKVSYCSRSKLCRACWLLENDDKQAIKYACVDCGKERSFYAKVCSDCFIPPSGSQHPNWKGGKATYSALWEKNKIIALKRDNYTCQICFRKGGHLDVHHIKFLSTFSLEENDKAHDLSNLITLCRGCHNHLHGKDIDEVLKVKKHAK
jgi:5-methylcytosine-specific restriction endonuclease McrA